ncbi:MAG: AbrB/MazE/SpoVT family DNA-binding domain-containing protein [Candidatus Riflebacteria bacterium]|nr:AbrB/MazE/SpoVT family DNA-binding domain-containing protein [Candidatus Riflebacteria bacterium]
MKESIVLKVDTKGRLTLPLKMRKDFHIEPGDVFFVKPEKTGIHLAKAENPFDDLVEYARHERKTGKSIELRAFAKKHKIAVKK